MHDEPPAQLPLVAHRFKRRIDVALGSIHPCGSHLVGSKCSGRRRVFSSWPTTTNYLGFVDFEKAIDGQIHVLVGGQYALYLGGDLIGEAEMERD